MRAIGRGLGAMAGRLRARPSGLPMGALGMVALIVVTEAFISAHDEQLTSLGTYAWRYSARAAGGEARNHEILCLGSSLTKHGVLSRVLGHGTGLTCFNLAIGNGRIVSSYYLFKRALEAGAHPAAVVVDCIDGPVDSQDRNGPMETLESNWRNWPEILTLRDTVELAVAARSAEFLNAVLLTRALPSYRTRFEIRAMLLAIARRETVDDARLWIRVARRNWDFNRGSIVSNRPEPPIMPEPRPRPAAHGADMAVPATTGGSLIANRLGEVYTHKLLELAQAHEITVFWLLPPMLPATQAERVRNGYDAYFTRVARGAIAEFPRVVVIDGRNAGYPVYRFSDLIHLGRLGSYGYSTDLAALVKQHLAAPGSRSGAGTRWYELPRYRDRPIELPMEDMSASARYVVRTDRERRDRQRRDRRSGAAAWAARDRGDRPVVRK